MLKKMQFIDDHFVPGVAVFLLTKKGIILEGFTIQDRLMDLISLDRSPIDGTEKQGFTLEGGLLRPNWCAGKRVIEAGFIDRKEAEKMAQEILHSENKVKTIPQPCKRNSS